MLDTIILGDNMKEYIKENLIQYIISLVFSFSINLKLQINYSKQFPDYFINQFHFDLFFIMKVVAISFLCYFVLQLLMTLLSKIKSKEMIVPYSKKVLCIISFSGILITNLLFLLTYYPGSNMNDTLSIIQGPISSSSQHPIIYNLLLSGTYHLFFKIFHNMNLAFFFTSFLQLIFMDIIITYLINWFHQTFKNKVCTILLLIYFIGLPIVANYNTVLIKDSLFSALILLHIPLLYQLISTNGDCLQNIKYLLKMAILFLFTIWIRNNGLYVVLFLSIILLYIYKNYWKQLGSILLVTITLSQIPNLLIQNNTALFQEKVGIPIQQLAYIITYDNQNISKSDLQYLNKLMDIQQIKQNYNPYSVDTIKWNQDFNRNYLNKTKSTFIKIWITNLPTHLESYIKSYLLTTYELWSMEKFNPTQSRFLGITKDDYYDTNYYKDLNHKQIFPTKIQNYLESYYKNTTVFFGNGTCFLILMILSLLAIKNNKKNLVILSIPLISIWITLMISAPIAYAFRYMSPYLYYLPFLLSITFCYNKNLPA